MSDYVPIRILDIEKVEVVNFLINQKDKTWEELVRRCYGRQIEIDNLLNETQSK